MPDEPITSFEGDFAFLSIFYFHPVEIDGDTYPTNEHAFQALKTPNSAERILGWAETGAVHADNGRAVLTPDGGESKTPRARGILLGGSASLRHRSPTSDWSSS